MGDGQWVMSDARTVMIQILLQYQSVRDFLSPNGHFSNYRDFLDNFIERFFIYVI